MENRTFKLDIYDNKVCNNLYSCDKDEKYCKSMISKLVFFDRDEILQMHADSIMNREIKYDVSTLKTVPFLEKNEKVERVVPLEGHWIAVFFADKNTKEVINNKVMYISSDGDGYFSDNVECALKGTVPEEIYAIYVKENPNGLLILDRKFKEDDYSESRKKLYDIARSEITRLFANFLGNPDIKLEDLESIISDGFRHKEDKEKFEKVKLLDFLYCQTIAEKIIDFDKKYNEYHSASEPGEKE